MILHLTLSRRASVVRQSLPCHPVKLTAPQYAVYVGCVSENNHLVEINKGVIRPVHAMPCKPRCCGVWRTGRELYSTSPASHQPFFVFLFLFPVPLLVPEAGGNSTVPPAASALAPSSCSIFARASKKNMTSLT